MEVESARTVVYPWLCDSMGHLATQHYMRIFDDATFHLLARIGYVLRDAPSTQRGWADVSHSIEYRREVRSGDLIVGYSTVLKVGNTSLSYRTRLVRVDAAAEDCALLVGVMVYFDLLHRRALPIQGPIRSAAAEMIEDAHAGGIQHQRSQGTHLPAS
jgi:acyl-CoA thioester hydrolase